MRERIEALVSTLHTVVAALGEQRLPADEAERLVSLFAEAERLCQAGRTLAAQRVLRTKYWRAEGFRTPAQWLASRTMTPLGYAISAVENADRLDSCRATREEFLAGRLSETQSAAITAAASADPAAEQELLDVARRETVRELRERCREVRFAAAGDEDANERIRRGRFLRHWADRDGAIRLDGRFAPDDGARLISVVEASAARLQEEARKSGVDETRDAHLADALVHLASGETPPKTVVHVHVDESALERGALRPGETSRIDGIGPIPVSSVRRMITDGIVKALSSEGTDVRAIAHLGRAIPAKIRTALEARDETCVVPGCEVRSGLEIDHIVPFAVGGPTSLENLARLCRYHHAQKTHRGWHLGGSPGAWTWTRPGRGAIGRSTPRRERTPGQPRTGAPSG